MSLRYRITPLADGDLLSIHRYIAIDDPVAAGELLQVIKDKFAMIARQPAVGSLWEDIRPDVRYVLAGRNVIFYELRDNLVTILRVIHSARDIPSLEI